MATISIQAGNGGQGSFQGMAHTLTSITRAVALATVLVAGAGTAQAADSNDRIVPPNPADVAILRSLLALQHPALRQGGSMALAPAAAAPTTMTEPGQQSGQTTPATEGEACVAPASGTETECGFGAETAAIKKVGLADSFRASLDRSMAAAGYAGSRL